jgi:preprotein translocase subunit SecA
MRHFDVQLIGGRELCRHGLAEMQTGEGKTLTATLPTYLYALYGRGSHLATVNDYLARRDAELMGPLYRFLGLSIGVVESGTEPADRRKAYACDITYGTAKEFGFDYLRDCIQRRSHSEAGSNLVGRLLGEGDKGKSDKPLQREPFFMLVDEADSILIDDAGTPLIIAGAAGEIPEPVAARYQFAAAIADGFRESEHYRLDLRTQRVELNPAGRERLRSLSLPSQLNSVGLITLYDDLERAILVQRLYQRDRNYVVRDGEIAIVDEFTGRIAEGRKWRAGIHQAVEAKEGVELSDDGGQAARITVQEFFLRYPHLAGMSGTARSSARELRRIYRLRVAAVPTNRPPIRKRLTPKIFGTEAAKWDAVVAEVVELHAASRPVLIGTRSIDKSDRLSLLLRAAGIEHEVLNAHYEPREAEIFARAGEQGRVTVATNMAGRGTDVRLGPGVSELGGLHVILTEMHDSARIDRQFVGRSGRQGDPGSFRYFLSLEDELLRSGLGPRRAERWKMKEAAAAAVTRLERLFHRAQRTVERRKFRERKRLLDYEKRRNEAARPLGLDPHLDLPG